MAVILMLRSLALATHVEIISEFLLDNEMYYQR